MGERRKTNETMGRTSVEPANLEDSKPLIGVKKVSDMVSRSVCMVNEDVDGSRSSY